ncbi:MAG: 50S ribosomal protein L11 methyltransferase [Crocinitomicaceae bacterium]|nr:50S ribosomal protein L11 methyltransferase [Crocinitomicaceae bacterium]
MNYIEVSISFDPKKVDGEILLAEVAQIPFESFIENEGELLGYILKNEFSEAELKLIPIINENQLEVTCKEIQQINWNEEWEKNFDPIEISQECVVRADFHEKSKNYKYDIRINPKMSFGTGHHATTSLMLAQMLDLDFKNSLALDMGTGTGVLAILATMMGANNVLAIDNDEWAYRNSVENVALNHCTDNIDVKEGDVSLIGGRKFNFVLANINKNVIKAQLSDYVDSMEQNALILLSGILKEDCDEIIELGESLGLTKLEQKQKDKWSLLVFSN